GREARAAPHVDGVGRSSWRARCLHQRDGTASPVCREGSSLHTCSPSGGRQIPRRSAFLPELFLEPEPWRCIARRSTCAFRGERRRVRSVPECIAAPCCSCRGRPEKGRRFRTLDRAEERRVGKESNSVWRADTSEQAY